MTDVQEAEQVARAELIERGRYAINAHPDGRWEITRAVGICERCESCGCGEQQPDPIPVPAVMVPYITGQVQASMKDMFGMIKGLFANGQ